MISDCALSPSKKMFADCTSNIFKSSDIGDGWASWWWKSSDRKITITGFTPEPCIREPCIFLQLKNLIKPWFICVQLANYKLAIIFESNSCTLTRECKFLYPNPRQICFENSENGRFWYPFAQVCDQQSIQSIYSDFVSPARHHDSPHPHFSFISGIPLSRPPCSVPLFLVLSITQWRTVEVHTWTPTRWLQVSETHIYLWENEPQAHQPFSHAMQALKIMPSPSFLQKQTTHTSFASADFISNSSHNFLCFFFPAQLPWRTIDVLPFLSCFAPPLFSTAAQFLQHSPLILIKFSVPFGWDDDDATFRIFHFWY